MSCSKLLSPLNRFQELPMRLIDSESSLEISLYCFLNTLNYVLHTTGDIFRRGSVQVKTFTVWGTDVVF